MIGNRAVFVDTNVIVYAFTSDRRNVVAETIMQAGFIISVQILNEFVIVARRKLKMDWSEIGDALAVVRQLSVEVRHLDLAIHVDALALAERYQFRFYDALVIASALAARCNTLLSEDMHDGLVVDGQLTIRNPFNALATPPA